ncbi:amidohydrolase family protein [Saccharothrix sp. S26]|uniref:metal-dependent hydrolase family protein n=1 Tax=Saccharothrix sp. S26 TaxID=2907215 RepID=UPI001F3A0758|nr:amidohydrolase family protein [Saccharothrix sp. S26]MCE6998418.1 amidohydrolase family protein [Saccharothrix sp. S26]
MTGPHRGETLLIPDRLWDGVADSPVAGARVLVRDGRIASVGAQLTAAADAKVVELPGHTLLPGFIDCHVHVVDESLNTASVAEQTLRALPPLRTLLLNGFTTVRDLGGSEQPLTTALRDAVADGVIAGPRMVVAPNIVSSRGSHGDKNPELTDRHGLEVGVLGDGPAEVVRKVREQAKAGADWIKFAGSGGFSSSTDDPNNVTYSQAEMDALVATATDLHLPCAVHAFNDESVRRAVRAGVRSVEHASLVDRETLALLARHRVTLVPTLHCIDYFLDRLDDEEFWDGKPSAVRDQFREHADRLRETSGLLAGSGVTLAYGTDVGMFPYEESWKEFPALTRRGVEPVRALRAATSTAADLLDRADLGRVVPGATADLVAVPGDPFEDIEVTGQVDFVMQAGLVATAHRA